MALADLKAQPVAPRLIAAGVVAAIEFVVVWGVSRAWGVDNGHALKVGGTIAGITLAFAGVGEIAIAAS